MNSEIISKENPKIKYLKKLVLSGNKKSKEYFFLEGIRLIYDALLSSVIINELFYTEDIFLKCPEKMKKLINYANSSYKVSKDVIKSISDTKSPQGIVCICQKLDKNLYIDKINNVNKVIILENIQDPSNLGAIFRTAEALGLNSFILSNDCCDIYNPKVLRASMGAVFRLNIFFSDNLHKTIINLKNFDVYASVPDIEEKFITELNLNTHKSIAVVIGNEGKGVTQDIINICKDKITIPMKGKAESLNAAMATGIIMWEIMRNEL